MTTPEPPRTVLKALLQEDYMFSHREFTRAYDKAASEVDRSLIGCGPSKAQYYKWLAGDIKHRLPRGYHCRVLEAMFPGYRAEELFAAPDRIEQHTATPTARPVAPPTGHTSPTPVPAWRERETLRTSPRLRALMSWVDNNSPVKERDVHPPQFQKQYGYSRSHGVERNR
ncbi:hypothetical protein [Nocardia rhamnosiphila]|uniref:Uncharacterized protein n=1 Tax=Nocardia rhamnosiphila TaxID=426716 RepID=A0ABV2WZZ3_9NOCA